MSDATDDKLYRQLTDHYKSLETEIISREKMIADLCRSLGTKVPQDLVSDKRLRLNEAEANLSRLQQRISILEWRMKRAVTGDSNDTASAIEDQMKSKYFEDAEWRMAWRLLRSNDFTLPWLEMRREIEESLEEARRHISRAWYWRMEKITDGEADEWVETEWAQSVDRFKKQIMALNRRIFDYNLQVPNARFSLYALDLQDELKRLKTEPAT